MQNRKSFLSDAQARENHFAALPIGSQFTHSLLLHLLHLNILLYSANVLRSWIRNYGLFMRADALGYVRVTVVENWSVMGALHILSDEKCMLMEQPCNCVSFSIQSIALRSMYSLFICILPPICMKICGAWRFVRKLNHSSFTPLVLVSFYTQLSGHK